ncbi:hypothetical protein RUM4293_02860 [Ruegeria atlantica]|uniref:Uncharacterized protein n=1 Tax=Ruegeria atlantica TaxID=81569 RepID=A0A0P1E5J9_9RHOB|nr:hypothetical protein RUM4293_02860 [Ruegeria atlantica]
MVKQSKTELFPPLNDAEAETFGPDKNSSLKSTIRRAVFAAPILLYFLLMAFFLNRASAESYISIPW